MYAARWIVGSLMLFAGAWFSLIATGFQGDKPSILEGVAWTLPLYLLGWAAIPKRRSNPLTILAIALVPIAANVAVVQWIVERTATGIEYNLFTDRSEGLLLALVLWTITCLIFWIGLTLSLFTAWSRRKSIVEQA